MVEYTVSLDVYSNQYSVEEISALLGIESLDESKQNQARTDAPSISVAVFRIDAGSGTNLSELVDLLSTKLTASKSCLHTAKEKGIDSCINIGVFYDSAFVTIGFSPKVLETLNMLRMPVAVSCYQSVN